MFELIGNFIGYAIVLLIALLVVWAIVFVVRQIAGGC
jgi:hypothetical protein